MEGLAVRYPLIRDMGYCPAETSPGQSSGESSAMSHLNGKQRDPLHPNGVIPASFTFPPRLHAYLKARATSEGKSVEEFVYETLLDGLRRRFTTCCNKGEVAEEFLDFLTSRDSI